MDRITVQEIADKWGVSTRYVQSLCQKGRISGAERKGRDWMIPAGATRPVDGRSKAGKAAKKDIILHTPLVRHTPFLDMTDLYNKSGLADECIASLSYHPEAQALFAAEIAYSRGEIDKVHEQAKYFLAKKNDMYSVLSGGMLLSLVAMWKGDIHLWNEARIHICQAPCQDDMDRDILDLTLAAADSAIRNTKDFPDWFMRGCFDRIHRDAHPAAKVYYTKHLLISAQDLAVGNTEYDGVYGFGLMKTLPYIVEPMISQMVVDNVVMAEIYLRLIVAIAYHQYGDDINGAKHIDKAIHLCLADGLYGPLVEHRRQLGLFLDERLGMIDSEALKKVKLLHKQLHTGWTKIHNAITERQVEVTLTIREREVARLAAFGMTNPQIANQLSLSEHTVSSLINSAKNKAGVSNRDELVPFI